MPVFIFVLLLPILRSLLANGPDGIHGVLMHDVQNIAQGLGDLRELLHQLLKLRGQHLTGFHRL